LILQKGNLRKQTYVNYFQAIAIEKICKKYKISEAEFLRKCLEKCPEFQRTTKDIEKKISEI
jgi:hypothetical protein